MILAFDIWIEYLQIYLASESWLCKIPSCMHPIKVQYIDSLWSLLFTFLQEISRVRYELCPHVLKERRFSFVAGWGSIHVRTWFLVNFLGSALWIPNLIQRIYRFVVFFFPWTEVWLIEFWLAEAKFQDFLKVIWLLCMYISFYLFPAAVFFLFVLANHLQFFLMEAFWLKRVCGV